MQPTFEHAQKVQFIYDNSDNLDNYFILFRHKNISARLCRLLPKGRKNIRIAYYLFM